METPWAIPTEHPTRVAHSGIMLDLLGDIAATQEEADYAIVRLVDEGWLVPDDRAGGWWMDPFIPDDVFYAAALTPDGAETATDWLKLND